MGGETKAESSPVIESGVLYVSVLGAKDIIGVNRQGQSSPYCVVKSSFNKQTFRTSTIKHTLDPLWDETFKFYTTVLSGYIKVILQHGRWMIPERLGKALIPLSMLRAHNPVNEWFTLEEPKRNRSSRMNPGQAAKIHIMMRYPTNQKSSAASLSLSMDNPKAHVKISDIFKLGQTLGHGGFSIVYEATNLATQQQVALKVIRRQGAEYDSRLLHREIDIMRKLDHPNIIKLYDVLEDDTNIYLVLELVTGGELFDQIISRGSFSEADAASIIRQILEAVSYMHSNGIAHRDLKPENLLVSGPNSDKIKVTDFGLSKNFGNSTLFTSCGTPDYVAPEVLKGAPYDNRVDVWSTGVITYILICGYPPFYGHNDQEVFSRILFAKYDFGHECWDPVSAEAKNFISSLLVLDATKRLSAAEALKHPWLVGNAPKATLGTFKIDAFESYNDKRNRERHRQTGSPAMAGVSLPSVDSQQQ